MKNKKFFLLVSSFQDTLSGIFMGTPLISHMKLSLVVTRVTTQPVKILSIDVEKLHTFVVQAWAETALQTDDVRFERHMSARVLTKHSLELLYLKCVSGV